jgi:hypothetical protein
MQLSTFYFQWWSYGGERTNGKKTGHACKLMIILITYQSCI